MMALHVLGAGAVLFVLGAASMPLMKAAAPLIGRVFRPVIRTAVNEGILIQREVQAVVQEARQGIENVTAEARAEFDRPQRGDAETSRRCQSTLVFVIGEIGYLRNQRQAAAGNCGNFRIGAYYDANAYHNFPIQLRQRSGAITTSISCSTR
jgi:hypothetical protein